MQIKLTIDNIPITEKLKDNKKWADLRSRLATAGNMMFVNDGFIEAADLFSQVEKFAFCPALLSGQNSDSWESQQVIGFDVDNSFTDRETGEKKVLNPQLLPEQALNVLKAHDIETFLMYHTFSRTEQNERFRGIVVCEKPLPDQATAAKYANRIIDILNRVVAGSCDGSTTDGARIFLPGGEGSCFYRGGKVTSIEALAALPESEVERREREWRERVKEREARKAQKIRPGKYQEAQADIVNQVRGFDLLGFVIGLTGQAPKRVASSYRFNPCPICGHRDCFGVSFSGSEWFCFSDDHAKSIHRVGAGWKFSGSGGGILEFLSDYFELQYGRSMDFGQCKDYFIQQMTQYDVNALLELFKQEGGAK